MGGPPPTEFAFFHFSENLQKIEMFFGEKLECSALSSSIRINQSNGPDSILFLYCRDSLCEPRRGKVSREVGD